MCFIWQVFCYLPVNSSDDSTVSPASWMCTTTTGHKNSPAKQEWFNLTSAVSYNPLFLSFSLHILLYSSCHGLSMCILCFRGIFPAPSTLGLKVDHKSLCFCPPKQHLLCNQLLADVSVPYRLCRPISPLGMRKSKGNHQRASDLLLTVDKAGLSRS